MNSTISKPLITTAPTYSFPTIVMNSEAMPFCSGMPREKPMNVVTKSRMLMTTLKAARIKPKFASHDFKAEAPFVNGDLVKERPSKPFEPLVSTFNPDPQRAL